MVDHLECARILGQQSSKAVENPKSMVGDKLLSGLIELLVSSMPARRVSAKKLDLCEVKEFIDGDWADVA